MAQEVSIASLRPDTIQPDAAIRGIVTLVWPYSLSTQIFAFLLGAEDFRTRSRHGQIRVRFSGPAAGAVAGSKIGITDRVKLSLNGARWIEDTDVRTPGKSVSGEIAFRNKLHLEIINDATETRQVNVDQDEADPATPAPITPSKQVLRLLLGPDAAEFPRVDTYRSPAFQHHRPTTLSQETDPFLDDLLDDDSARKRTRVSFGKVKDWRVARRTPSPVKQMTEGQYSKISASSDAATTAPDDTVQPSSLLMLPPITPVPRLMATTTINDKFYSRSNDIATPLTPTLRPVTGMSLPLPSPFPDESMQSHFSNMGEVRSLQGDQVLKAVTDEIAAGSTSAAISPDPEMRATSTSPSQTEPKSADSRALLEYPEKLARAHPSGPVKVVDSSVMTSLFGTPPKSTTDAEPQQQPAQHIRPLSDFDLAAMPFADVTNGPTSAQNVVKENVTPGDSEDKPHSIRAHEQHSHALASDAAGTSLGRDGHDSISTKIDDMLGRKSDVSAVPPAMLKWATPRHSLDGSSRVPPIQDSLEELSSRNGNTVRIQASQSVERPVSLQASNNSHDAGYGLVKKVTTEPVILPQNSTKLQGKTRSSHDISGLQTPHAYFTRLRMLDRYVNVKNRNESSVDVIAAVSRSPKPAQKLQKGPRDFFTMLHVKDHSTDEDIQVEMYRPYRSSLPQAAAGDVVLLRGFHVHSHGHKPFLKSTDASSWCVWRFASIDEDESDVRAEMLGPPVEYGSEETSEAVKLQEWFSALGEAQNSG